MTDIDDLLGGGAAGKSMKFDQIGKSYSGVVVSSEARQVTDLQTGAPATWDDGSPQMQAVIGVQTDERNPELENDDGVRYNYVKMWGEQKKAFRAAAQVAGGSPKPGDQYRVTYIGDGEQKKRGFNAPKLFKYEITKANPIDTALGGLEAPAAPTPAPQAAPVAQAAPAAPAAPAASDSLTPEQEAQVSALIGKGLTDEQIARVFPGATEQDISVVRLQQAALASAGL